MFHRLIQKAKTMGLATLLVRGFGRIRRVLTTFAKSEFYRYTERNIFTLDRLTETLFDPLDESVTKFGVLAQKGIFLDYDSSFVRRVAEHYANSADEARENVALVALGKFRIAGGEVVSFGSETDIDWHMDPLSGVRWPKEYYESISEHSENGDVLSPWWLSSFYFLAPMAKHALYVQESSNSGKDVENLFTKVVQSWVKSNPEMIGINWNSTTIVSIRVINLVWALPAFCGAKSSDSLKAEVLRVLVGHGLFIRQNMEWFEVRTNHYLTNVLALYVLGVALSELSPLADEWREFAQKEMINEIGHHVYPDGSVHEGSINYHRFVTEIYLLFGVLEKTHTGFCDERVLQSLKKMLKFLAHSLNPRCEPSPIGDAADIRLLDLDERNPSLEVSNLLAVGAVLLSIPELVEQVEEFPEYAYWLLGEEGRDQFRSLKSVSTNTIGSKSFPLGGYHFIREGSTFLAIRCGPLALKGVSGHGHYDQLSFEFWSAGVPLLVDRGWYRYEGDRVAYDYLKSTSAHNTVQVDGRNQIESDLFVFPPPSRPVPKTLVWDENDSWTVFEGEHELYENLVQPVAHRRTLSFNKKTGSLTGKDLVDGSGEHLVELYFHFAPDVKIESSQENVMFKTAALSGSLKLDEVPANYRLKAFCSIHAPKYGKKVGAPSVVISFRCKLPVSFRWSIVLDEKEL